MRSFAKVLVITLCSLPALAQAASKPIEETASTKEWSLYSYLYTSIGYSPPVTLDTCKIMASGIEEHNDRHSHLCINLNTGAIVVPSE